MFILYWLGCVLCSAVQRGPLLASVFHYTFVCQHLKARTLFYVPPGSTVQKVSYSTYIRWEFIWTVLVIAQILLYLHNMACLDCKTEERSVCCTLPIGYLNTIQVNFHFSCCMTSICLWKRKWLSPALCVISKRELDKTIMVIWRKLK